MNKWKIFIGIVAFSMVLLCVLYALNQYEKIVCYQEDIDAAKHELQLIIEAIDLFHDHHGRLPSALQDLVPEFVKVIPTPKCVEKVYYHVGESKNFFEISFRVTSRSETVIYTSDGRQWHQYRS